MKHFTIDGDKNITAYETIDQANTACESNPGITKYFGSPAELADAVKDFAGADLVELWNSLPGVVPVKKFQSTATGVNRIWTRLTNTNTSEENEPMQRKTTTKAPKAKATAKKRAKAAKPAKEAVPVAREGTKKAKVIQMLSRANGAGLEEIMEKMEWQPHTTRSLLSAGGSLAKAGIKVESFKGEKGDRRYRIAS